MAITKKGYRSLVKGHGANELAANLVFPVNLSDKQKKASDAKQNDVLAQRRAAMSVEYKVKARMLQFRLQLEEYLNEVKFDRKKTFGFFLKHHINSRRKKQKVFAREIHLKPAVLSQYINDHRTPPQNIMVRLELHSGNIIPAVDWYRLKEKESMYELSTNKELRKSKKRLVRNELASL